MRGSKKNGERGEQVRKNKKRPSRIELLHPQTKGEMIREPIAQIKERLGDILQNLSDLIWEVDENGILTWCSGAAEDIFSVTARDLIGKRLFDFMPAEEAQRINNIIEEISLKKEIIKDLEAYNEDKKGRRHWLCLNGIPILDNKGTLKGYIGVCRDITSQKKAEESLRESELKFRTLAEEAFDSIAIHDGQRIIEVNKAFGRLWGYDPKETAGLEIDKLFAPECWRNVEKRVQAGYDKPYEAVAIRNDGSRFAVEIAGCSITYKGRKMRIATTRDITERKRAEEELLWKTAFLESQVEANLDGMLVVDSNNQKILTNKRLIEMWKVPQHIAEDKEDAALLQYVVSQVKDPEQFLEKVKYLYSHNDQTSRDEIEFKNGMVFDRYSSPVVDKNGKYFGRIWTFRNITEHRALENTLEKERQELKLIIDSSPIIVFYKDKEGRFVRINKAFADAMNMSEEKFLGKTVFDIYSGKFAQAMTDDDQEIFRTGKPKLNIIEQYESVSGERWVQTDKIPIFDKEGTLAGLVGFAQDITERKQAEEKLQEDRNLLRTLIDNIPDKVYVKDKDSRFIVCNKTISDFWKSQGQKSIVGKTDFDLFETAEAQKYFDEEQKVIQTGKPVLNKEGYCPDKKGENNYLLVTKVPLRDSHGGVIGLLGIHRDITARKVSEEKLLEYQKQLKRLAAQLALTEERERRRIAGELHDHVNQSLALAKIKLDSLHAALSSQPMAGVIEDISGSIEKAIQDTRTLTFDLSNPILYELGFEAAVSEWLDENVRVKHKINTEFQDDGRDKPLGDDMRALLFRNVRELLINAIKYSGADKVRVSVRRIDDSIEVIVEDNGVGFDPVEVRTLASKRAEFGLFSIRESLEELGGRFEIESKPGAGCKATMTSPLKSKS